MGSLFKDYMIECRWKEAETIMGQPSGNQMEIEFMVVWRILWVRWGSWLH